jgi:hypothetical protein
MDKINILSAEQLKELFNQFGLRAVAQAKQILVVPKALLLESLMNASYKDSLTIIKIHGFTVKFDTNLLPKIQVATNVEISLFESEIDNKPIKWARITAAV